MNIREARTDEVKTLQILNDEIFIDNQKYDNDLDMGWAQSDKGKNYFTELLNNPTAYCLVAEEDNKLVGYISLEPKIFSYRNSNYIEISNMGVTPDYRSKGIGSQLIKEGIKWAKNQRFKKVFVTSYYGNSRAIDFYKRSGFAAIDVSLEMTI